MMPPIPRYALRERRYVGIPGKFSVKFQVNKHFAPHINGLLQFFKQHKLDVDAKTLRDLEKLRDTQCGAVAATITLNRGDVATPLKTWLDDHGAFNVSIIR